MVECQNRLSGLIVPEFPTSRFAKNLELRKSGKTADTCSAAPAANIRPTASLSACAAPRCRRFCRASPVCPNPRQSKGSRGRGPRPKNLPPKREPAPRERSRACSRRVEPPFRTEHDPAYSRSFPCPEAGEVSQRYEEYPRRLGADHCANNSHQHDIQKRSRHAPPKTPALGNASTSGTGGLVISGGNCSQPLPLRWWRGLGLRARFGRRCHHAGCHGRGHGWRCGHFGLGAPGNGGGWFLRHLADRKPANAAVAAMPQSPDAESTRKVRNPTTHTVWQSNT